MRDGPVHNWATLAKAAQAKAAFRLQAQGQEHEAKGNDHQTAQEGLSKGQGRKLVEAKEAGDGYKQSQEGHASASELKRLMPRLGVVPPCTSSE